MKTVLLSLAILAPYSHQQDVQSAVSFSEEQAALPESNVMANGADASRTAATTAQQDLPILGDPLNFDEEDVDQFVTPQSALQPVVQPLAQPLGQQPQAQPLQATIQWQIAAQPLQQQGQPLQAQINFPAQGQPLQAQGNLPSLQGNLPGLQGNLPGLQGQADFGANSNAAVAPESFAEDEADIFGHGRRKIRRQVRHELDRRGVHH